MTKRGSIVLLLLVVFSSVIFLSPMGIVNASPTLNVGDEFLYRVERQYSNIENDTLLAYDDYGYSYMNYYEYSDFKIDYFSAEITGLSIQGDNVTYYANHTYRSYDLGYTHLIRNYQYNGDWYLSWEDYYDGRTAKPEDTNYSYFVQSEEFKNIPQTNVSVDFTGTNRFLSDYSINYLDTITWEGLVNGQTQTITVEVYELYYNYTWDAVSYYYDFNYTVTYVEEYKVKYYVDPTTGIALQYDYFHFVTWVGGTETYSSDINSNVKCETFGNTTDAAKYLLIETTADYYPVSDASLPGIVNYNIPYSIKDNTTPLNFDFEIYDPSGTMDIEVIVDDKVVGFWSNLASGWVSLTIDPKDIEYFGPYVSHPFVFRVYDSNNYAHNVSWVVYINDERIKEPQWPCWLEGPADVTGYTVNGYVNIEYYVYADSNWTLNVYNTENMTYPEYVYGGYLNETVYLYLSLPNYATVLTYYLELIDGGGYVFTFNLTITVIEGSDIWPTIYGPGDYIDYYLGTDYYLYYTIYDDDPTIYQLLVNGTVVLEDNYIDGQSVNINLRNYINAAGTYNLTLAAHDNTGHVSTFETIVYAIVDNEPPSINLYETEIYMNEGENRFIRADIYDNNPGFIEIFRNGELVGTFQWMDPYYYLEFSLRNLSAGTWVFDIVATDAFNNTATVTVTVHVSSSTVTTGTGTDTGTDTETNTESTSGGDSGTTTLTINAPGALIAIFGLLGVTTITAVFRRKNR